MTGGALAASDVNSHLRAPIVTTHAHFWCRIMSLGAGLNIGEERKGMTSGTVFTKTMRNGDEIHGSGFAILFMTVGAIRR